jgi:hypothetical protein
MQASIRGRVIIGAVFRNSLVYIEQLDSGQSLTIIHREYGYRPRILSERLSLVDTDTHAYTHTHIYVHAHIHS